MFHDPLAADLREAFGEANPVIDSLSTINRLEKSSVYVYTTAIEPLGALGSRYQVTMTVDLMSKHGDPAKAEPDLAAMLETLVEALWQRKDYMLTSATRTVNEDRTLHSWTCTVQAGIEIGA